MYICLADLLRSRLTAPPLVGMTQARWFTDFSAQTAFTAYNTDRLLACKRRRLPTPGADWTTDDVHGALILHSYGEDIPAMKMATYSSGSAIATGSDLLIAYCASSAYIRNSVGSQMHFLPELNCSPHAAIPLHMAQD